MAGSLVVKRAQFSPTPDAGYRTLAAETAAEAVRLLLEERRRPVPPPTP